MSPSTAHQHEYFRNALISPLPHTWKHCLPSDIYSVLQPSPGNLLCERNPTGATLQANGWPRWFLEGFLKVGLTGWASWILWGSACTRGYCHLLWPLRNSKKPGHLAQEKPTIVSSEPTTPKHQTRKSKSRYGHTGTNAREPRSCEGGRSHRPGLSIQI